MNIGEANAVAAGLSRPGSGPDGDRVADGIEDAAAAGERAGGVDATVASLLRRAWAAGVQDGRDQADEQLRESLTQRDADLDQVTRELAAVEAQRRDLAGAAVEVQKIARALAAAARDADAALDDELRDRQGIAERLLEAVQVTLVRLPSLRISKEEDR